MSTHFLHTGSAILNLALTGHPAHGWPLGRVSNIIGDKSAGKSLLAIEAAKLAQTNPPPKLKKVDVHYIETEAAFDFEYAEQLGLNTDTVNFYTEKYAEDIYDVLDRVVAKPKKHHGSLVIVDSWDSVEARTGAKKDIADRGYGMQKQRLLGDIFRRLIRPLEDAHTHLMIISQIRENITELPFAPRWRRNGGKALDFWSSHIVWLHERAKLTRGEGLFAWGIQIEAKITKNKTARPFRNARFPILFDYGIDDIYSMFEFLESSKLTSDIRVPKTKGGIRHWRGVDKRLHDLVAYVEESPDAYFDLLEDVWTGWLLLEKKSVVNRRNKAELISSIDYEALEGEEAVA